MLIQTLSIRFCKRNLKASKFKITNRLEIQILDVNISILSNGDIFAAVLPENVFSSENTWDFRNYLKSNFDLS